MKPSRPRQETPRPELQFRVAVMENYKSVILGGGSASLHTLAGAGPVSGARSGDLLSREGRFLNYALRRDERYGVWGGMSERERRRLKRMAS